jgi:hypothetical protein
MFPETCATPIITPITVARMMQIIAVQMALVQVVNPQIVLVNAAAVQRI